MENEAEATTTQINWSDPAEIWSQYGDAIIGFGMKALGALIVLIIGLRVAGWLGNLVKRTALSQENIDDTLGNFFGSLVRWGITAAVFIAALQVFGVEATSLVAILGALTLAIGLSLQGALGNIASGVMIMIFRPYSLGDYVEIAGVAGSVKEINLFQTVLSTPDNVQIMVPNSQAIDGVIKNYSGFPTRRVDVTFGIDYNDDMDKAISIVHGIVMDDPRIMSDPASFVKVVNLNDSSVDIQSRCWVKGADYWDVKFDLTKKVKSAFDEQGISIPYPHTMMIQKSE
ncbi:MAG: mechanosensitive ion channel domain-containing protein [Pseudomonadota bacterium]